MVLKKRILTWVPLTIDWNPEPHSLLTKSAGLSMGIPHFNATCLGRKAPSDAAD